jgi:WhiB family redox-sensing transcriptional regulator
VSAYRVLAVLVDVRNMAWADRGLCQETDPEEFFPEVGEDAKAAKRVCGGCEVRAECLEYALEHDQRFGVWGGTSERERRILRAERKAA